MKYWQAAVSKDYQLKKELKIDSKMCSVILSNAKVFGPMRLYMEKHSKDSHTWFFKNKVSGHDVGFKHFRQSNGKRTTYAYNYCLGESYEKGTFAHAVSKMTHLSQFLMFYSAWLAKKNTVTI